MMKNFLLCLIVLSCGSISEISGQELSVKSFELRPTDLTAKVANKKDLNGDVCAMVKIFVAAPTISVPDDMILDGVEKAAYSEFRVFVPAGSRRIQINVPGFLPLQYAFPEPLETMRTYELRLWNGGTPPPPQPAPRVGEFYSVGNDGGIVIEYNEAARCGKFIALTDGPEMLVWDDAVAYGVSVGNGWRLPAKDELVRLFTMRKDLAKWLKALGGQPLLEEPYWTGTNIDASKMFPFDVDMHTGKEGKIHKKNTRLVRLVYDFTVPAQY